MEQRAGGGTARGLRALLVVSFSTLSGCASFISDILVEAPNRGEGALLPSSPLDDSPVSARVRGLQVEIDDPRATLCLWAVEPPSCPEAAPLLPVLLLHGWHKDHSEVLDLGLELSQAGHRVIFADLRGHGSSSGEWTTYGVVESRDLARVLDELQAQHLIGGSIGLVGMSFGAATSLQLAAFDARVESVVALGSFASFRDVVHDQLPLFLGALAWFIPDGTIDEAVDLAGARGGFDPAAASPERVIARTEARILLIHGRDDWLVPLEHAQRNLAASGGRAELLVLEDVGHAFLLGSRLEPIVKACSAWFSDS